jgi:hypothetical protein
MDFEHAVGVALTSGVVSGVVVALVNDRLEKRRRDAAVREARRNDAARIVALRSRRYGTSSRSRISVRFAGTTGRLTR